MCRGFVDYSKNRQKHCTEFLWSPPQNEKFDAEKHIIEKMIRDSNKSVMDGGQLFHKYEDDSRDGDLIIEDSIDDLREMEMRFAAGEENDDRRHADAGLNQDNGRIPEGGVPAVRRQRHRQRLRDASIASDTGLDNDGRDQDEASTENESNGEGDDDEEEDQLFERMMRLQELGADEEPERNNRERVEPEVPEEGRFNPQFDPLDMPFDEDAAMVSRREHGTSRNLTRFLTLVFQLSNRMQTFRCH